MKQDYSRNVALACPTCAGDQFEFDEDIEPDARNYQCVDCGRVTAHTVLVAENSERVQIASDEIKNEVVKDFKKQLSKAFRGIK